MKEVTTAAGCTGRNKPYRPRLDLQQLEHGWPLYDLKAEA